LSSEENVSAEAKQTHLLQENLEIHALAENGNIQHKPITVHKGYDLAKFTQNAIAVFHDGCVLHALFNLAASVAIKLKRTRDSQNK
jgi:hypothetical protein